MLQRITMTPAETRTYDSGDDQAWRALREELLTRARALHAETGETVEVVTDDGIVAEVVQ